MEGSPAREGGLPRSATGLGGAVLAARDGEGALHAFREAVILDHQLIAGWIMLTRIRSARRRAERARAVLAEALTINPFAPELRTLARALWSRDRP